MSSQLTLNTRNKVLSAYKDIACRYKKLFRNSGLADNTEFTVNTTICVSNGHFKQVSSSNVQQIASQPSVQRSMPVIAVVV